MLPAFDGQLVEARQRLERGKLVPVELLSEPIRLSWERCLAAGLDPTRPPPIEIVPEATLRAARQRRDLLRRLVLGEMESLYQQIAGTNFMIAFAAADGLLLDSIADPSFSAEARASAIRPGTLWTEARCGTNALGTAAASGRGITVNGPEHFFNRYTTLTCTAAPVFGPDGVLAGVLDASSDCRSRQDHTRALVGMAATQIENGIFREHHRSDVLIAFHNRREYLHTLSAGLLAFDPGGMVLAANAQARFLLQGLMIRRGRSFAELFETSFGDLLTGSRQNAPQQLRDRIGSVFAARVENLHLSRPVADAFFPAPARATPKSAPKQDFVADDCGLATMIRQLETAAIRGLPILIRGETGTGKERVARHLHMASGRAGAFVPVNCAALPDTLVEAELFGHADGAFTGARRGGAAGLVCEADGGTLFLDEIGDMKLPLQAILLRLLDDWVVRPVGCGRTRKVDVLLISATNVDLSQARAAGRFRADLYYRLATVDAALPRLRERSDFAAVATTILASIAPGWRISDEAMRELAAQSWNGNIRELRGLLARVSLAGPGGEITPSMLSEFQGRPTLASQTPSRLRDSLRLQVQQAFTATGGNVSETARRLGVSRNTIYRLLAEQGKPARVS